MSKLANRQNDGIIDVFNIFDVFDAFGLTTELTKGISMRGLDTELTEDAENYVLRADMPGIKLEDVELTFDNGVLDISCKRTYSDEQGRPGSSKDETVHWQEQSYGKLNRRFKTNNVNPDRISAELKQGVLTVTLGKKEAAPPSAPKQIEIKTE